jgi:hypothetical protein
LDQTKQLAVVVREQAQRVAVVVQAHWVALDQPLRLHLQAQPQEQKNWPQRALALMH